MLVITCNTTPSIVYITINCIIRQVFVTSATPRGTTSTVIFRKPWTFRFYKWQRYDKWLNLAFYAKFIGKLCRIVLKESNLLHSKSLESTLIVWIFDFDKCIPSRNTKYLRTLISFFSGVITYISSFNNVIGNRVMSIITYKFKRKSIETNYFYLNKVLILCSSTL